MGPWLGGRIPVEKGLASRKQAAFLACQLWGWPKDSFRFSIPLYGKTQINLLAESIPGKGWTCVEFGSSSWNIPLPFLPQRCPWKEISCLYCLSSFFHLYMFLLFICYWSIGLPRRLSGKDSTCQCRRCRRRGFDPWVGKIAWKREWQPTPVFLSGESHGQRSLVDYRPWVRKEQDTAQHACIVALRCCITFCYITNTCWAIWWLRW